MFHKDLPEMGEILKFSNITAETKGSLTPGKLKLSAQGISFKNNKTGKVERISGSELEFVNWQKMVGSWGLRLFLKNGSLHRFYGFRESEQDKIAQFFKNKYSMDMLEKELSVKGWNWGTAKFSGSVLSFDIGNLTAFEIPLHNVSQCTTSKNEATLEFHQNDDAPVMLMEMRFHIPLSELTTGEMDPVDTFHKQVMDRASVISISGDIIAIFREIQCLTPRGHYDIKVFNTFFQLHGKTFDYKIPLSTVLRLFLLPHKNGRQNYFVVSLDPPIKQGQTRYHLLVFLFGQEDEISIELPFSEEELKEKYEEKLTKELSGPTWEVVAKLMSAIVNRRITTPGGFIGNTGTPAIGCSYKAAAGFLYPLERGFIFIHKPPIHIRFEEVSSVNFARSGGSTRSFDFEVELKSSIVHTFYNIEKEEYTKLFDFISSKMLRVKNRGKSDKPNYTDDFSDSDQEKAPNAYLAQAKRVAKEQEDDNDGRGDSDESTDEDFNPDAASCGESDVAEEYDSNPEPTDSDEDSDTSGDDRDYKKKEKKVTENGKKNKFKSAKTISEKPRKPRKKKKDKDANTPKRPPTAFMLFLKEKREKIKKDNPGIAFLEISKMAGEMWKNLEKKKEYEDKASKMKEEYKEAMAEYKASRDEKGKETMAKSKYKSSPKKSISSSKEGTGNKYISKEFIEESDSSDSASDKSKKTETNKSGKEKRNTSSGNEDGSGIE